MSKVQQSFHDFGFPEAIPNESPLRGEGGVDAPGETYNDDRAGDGDSRQHAMSDGVRFDGVLDALIVTVDPSFIWLEHDVHNNGGKCRCSGKKQKQKDFIRWFHVLPTVGEMLLLVRCDECRFLSVIYDAWPQPSLSLVMQSGAKVGLSLLRLMF